MNTASFDKTDKGREEIATRKHQLPTRLRSLLVLIDGKQTDEMLLQKTESLGINHLSLQKLAQDGFIQRITNGTASEPERLEESLDGSEDKNETSMTDSTIGFMGDLEESQTIFEPSENDDGWTADLDAIMSEHDDDDRESRVDMMKRYLGQIIKEHLGIRGFFLQRKLVKAASLEDLHAFRQDYVSALLNIKGKELAIAMRDQFDQRMYVRFSLTEPEFLDEKA
ncbi:MAG: hypothetical protein E6Q34_09850 [Burkholderiaceae bacterium]|nr:MAG: hypothetical protein E6Q34_09850 [Burkholderiaceae bacterium]